jgi:hypothetical protein
VGIALGGRFLATTAAGCLVAAGVTGCPRAAAEPATRAATVAPAAPVTRQWPASVAGGACQLLDYATIETAIEVRFDVAAASRQGKTLTCAVQHSDASRPDLTLAVTATTADAAIFRGTMVPDKAQQVDGLGKAAYRLRIARSKTQGPGVEVGWLSASKRLLVLRFTFPPGAEAGEVNAVSTGLVNLAKRVDQARE